MFRNAMPRYEVLSQEAMATLDKGWRRLMTEIGVEFMDDRALELFRKAGQRVEDNTVFLDPDFVLEQVAKAPREFDVQARNHDNDIHIGGVGGLESVPGSDLDLENILTKETNKMFGTFAIPIAHIKHLQPVESRPRDWP